MSLRNPVRYPVKFYSWKDTQAPQLSDVDGAVKTILKACLVTGYGSKAGAGWTSLFEDDYRIVLRRPLRTGNPPDIKIENGVTKGVTRHKIVTQNNPTGLDDANVLAQVNLLTRPQSSANLTPEWYCLVTDFACMLVYGIDGMHMTYIGGVSAMSNAINEIFVVTDIPAMIGADGRYTSSAYTAFPSDNYQFRNARVTVSYKRKNILTLGWAEKGTGDYLAQNIVVDDYIFLPFMIAMSTNIEDNLNKNITIDSRPMFRYVQKSPSQSSEVRAIYIPIDYWEL